MKKIIKLLLLASTLFCVFTSCTKTLDLPEVKAGDDPYGISNDPVNNNSKTYKVNLNDLLKIGIFDYLNEKYIKSFEITSAFSELPKVGDKIEVSFEGIAPASLRNLYCNIYDNSYYFITNQSDFILVENLQEGKDFKGSVIIPVTYKPVEALYIQLYYDQLEYNNRLVFGKSTGFGATAPKDCDSIWDFKNTDCNDIAISTMLFIDGKVVEASDFKLIKPNASVRFYYNFTELEAKYGEKLYSNNSYFIRNIHVFPFSWTSPDSKTINWSSNDWYGWFFNPSTIKNEKRTTLESFKYRYDSASDTYYHSAYDNEHNTLEDLTEQDKINPDLPYFDTVVNFPYNPYGPNYQTTISLFDDTPLAKGDKIKLTISGISYDSIEKLYVNIADVSEEADYWLALSDDLQIFTTNINGEIKFSAEYTIEITKDPISNNPKDTKLFLNYVDLKKETSIEHCTISFEKL